MSIRALILFGETSIVVPDVKLIKEGDGLIEYVSEQLIVGWLTVISVVKATVC